MIDNKIEDKKVSKKIMEAGIKKDMNEQKVVVSGRGAKVSSRRTVKVAEEKQKRQEEIQKPLSMKVYTFRRIMRITDEKGTHETATIFKSKETEEIKQWVAQGLVEKIA